MREAKNQKNRAGSEESEMIFGHPHVWFILRSKFNHATKLIASLKIKL